MGTPGDLDEGTLQDLYNWVDTISFSRPKKNIARDFSDGVLVAEIVKSYYPTLVELHNYAASNSTHNKITNWHTLNRKVFKKLKFELSADVINNLVNCKVGVIEHVLLILRSKIDRQLFEQQRKKTGSDQAYSDHSERPEADQLGGYLQPSTSNQSGYGETSPGLSARHGDLIYHKQTEMIPKLLLEEREQENLAKEETIKILKEKIERLEHLLHLKDIRIDDLQARLEQVEKKYRSTAGSKK